MIGYLLITVNLASIKANRDKLPVRMFVLGGQVPVKDRGIHPALLAEQAFLF